MNIHLPLTVLRTKKTITVSVGFGVCLEDAAKAMWLLSRAENALVESKFNDVRVYVATTEGAEACVNRYYRIVNKESR